MDVLLVSEFQSQYSRLSVHVEGDMPLCKAVEASCKGQ